MFLTFVSLGLNILSTWIGTDTATNTVLGTFRDLHGFSPHNSPKQLDCLLQSQESGTFERKTKFKDNETLDSLYTSILWEAFGGDDPENDFRVRSILGAVVGLRGSFNSCAYDSVSFLPLSRRQPQLTPWHS